MRQIEKASIFRIVSDLIKSDAILDIREMEFLDSIRKKYAITKEAEIQVSSLTIADAISCLRESPTSLKHDYITSFITAVFSDKYCTREEALLLVALRICLTIKTEMNPIVLSLDSSSLHTNPTQVLYVESEFDNDINWNIHEHYREIVSEIRLAGFDFVYLPKIAEHYRSLSHNDFVRLTEFLYPNAKSDRIELLFNKLGKLSTSEFCRNQLARELKVEMFSLIPPSLLIKIGDSFVNHKKMANFLLLEMGHDVIQDVRYFIDLFTEMYHPLRISYQREEPGRFIYAGFYKQIFDLYMQRQGIRSSIVVDIYRNEIYLPEAATKIENLHRREKALYVLFLLETSNGGINFTKPEDPDQLKLYQKRMKVVQRKYALIYQEFGGESAKAPNIEIPTIRLPMISHIKRQLLKLDDVLFHMEDYTIQRNIYGNYGINLPSSLCCCCGIDSKDIHELSESTTWQRISAL